MLSKYELKELTAALNHAVKMANKGKLVPHTIVMEHLRKKYSKKKRIHPDI